MHKTNDKLPLNFKIKVKLIISTFASNETTIIVLCEKRGHISGPLLFSTLIRSGFNNGFSGNCAY